MLRRVMSVTEREEGSVGDSERERRVVSVTLRERGG
jgi:hypothetical protein